LDWFFIIYLGLDIQWAAIATIIAQGSVFIASVFYLNKTHKIIHFSFARLRFDKEIFKKSMAIGLPSGIQATLVGLSMVGLMWIINPFGKAVTAAFGAASRIDALASLPAMNFAAALATFVGQNMGANRPERVKKGLIATWLMTTVVSVTVTVIVILFNKQLIGLFAETEEMIAIGSDYLIIVSSFYAVFTTMFIIGGVMRGAGDTLIPMFITLFAVWVVRLPVAWLLSRTSLGVHGIWWAIPIGWATGMTLVCLYYSTGRWKKKVIVRPAIVEEPA
ncbi:MAG: MATE family efflux transporter, partial [Bacteroidota bacterium]